MIASAAPFGPGLLVAMAILLCAPWLIGATLVLVSISIVRIARGRANKSVVATKSLTVANALCATLLLLTNPHALFWSYLAGSLALLVATLAIERAAARRRPASGSPPT